MAEVRPATDDELAKLDQLRDALLILYEGPNKWAHEYSDALDKQFKSDRQLICTVARDRILCLAKEKERLSQLLLAARHLILAATGPEGGPTNWNETRDRWLALLDEHASVEGESRC